MQNGELISISQIFDHLLSSIYHLQFADFLKYTIDELHTLFSKPAKNHDSFVKPSLCSSFNEAYFNENGTQYSCKVMPL